MAWRLVVMLPSHLIKLTRYDAVFTFQVDVVVEEAKHDFLAKTDITWEDFQKRVIRYLDTNGQAVQLTCKLLVNQVKLLTLEMQMNLMPSLGIFVKRHPTPAPRLLAWN